MHATPQEALRHHVTGAICRGDAQAITEIPILSGQLPRGYESRVMHLVARKHFRRTWQLRLCANFYSVAALFNGEAAPDFKTRKAAIAWAAARGYVAAPATDREGKPYGTRTTAAAWCMCYERPKSPNEV